MRLIISRSIWRKLAVLVFAVVGFVFLYETRMLDSQYLALTSMMGRTQPPAGSQLRFDATAYCKGTTTASGVGVRTGIAAADPALLPVGSVLNVATGDTRYNGGYTVMDTGPRVQGRVLDLYMWNCNEALAFGRQEVSLTVLRLGWKPTNTTPHLPDFFRRKPQPPPHLPARQFDVQRFQTPAPPLPSKPIPVKPPGS